MGVGLRASDSVFADPPPAPVFVVYFGLIVLACGGERLEAPAADTMLSPSALLHTCCFALGRCLAGQTDLKIAVMTMRLFHNFECEIK